MKHLPHERKTSHGSLVKYSMLQNYKNNRKSPVRKSIQSDLGYMESPLKGANEIKLL